MATAPNLGTGGSVLDAQFGSSSTSNTNEPLALAHTGVNYLYLPGVTSNNASVPDSAALDLTTEADIQVRIAFDDWTPAVLHRIIWKGTTGGSNHAYGFNLNTNGTLGWQIGSTAGVIAGSSVVTGFTDGSAAWIRVTWRASDGRTQFFTAADSATVPSSWTQLGTDQTASLASLNNSTSALHIGEQATGGGNTVAGKVYRVRVLSTIGGTAVLDADFTSGITSGGQTSFTESSSNAATVTINRSTSGRKAVAVVRPVWLLGTDDFFQVADNDLLDFAATDSFTVVAVVRYWGTIANNSIVGKGTGNIGATMQGYQMFFSGGAPSFRLGDGTTRVGGVAVTTASSGSLAAYSFHRDVASDQVWAARNGTESSSRITDTTTGTLASGENMYIGGQAATSFSDCELLAAMVFRRTLSATELAAIAAYYGI
jgi:hypothetical protein